MQNILVSLSYCAPEAGNYLQNGDRSFAQWNQLIGERISSGALTKLARGLSDACLAGLSGREIRFDERFGLLATVDAQSWRRKLGSGRLFRRMFPDWWAV